jgi:ATP-dependent helicase IRC3
MRKPRYYQVEAIQAAIAAWNAGYTNIVVKLPTGCGKTFTGMNIARWIYRNGGRVLWLAHTEELVDQAAKDARTMMPNAKVGIVQGSRRNYDAAIVCASVGSVAPSSDMNRKGWDRLVRSCWKHGTFQLIVIDECHHAAADTYAALQRGMNALPSKAGSGQRPLVLGLTATIERADGKPLDGAFDVVAYDFPLKRAIDEGWLVPINNKKMSIPQLDLTKAMGVTDYDADVMGEQLARDHAVRSMGNSILHHTRWVKTIVFCCTVKHSESLARYLAHMGLRAASVTGKTPKNERRALVQAFRDGRLTHICNVGVFGEGADFPDAGAVAIGRPTRSTPLYTQMVGRGLRTSPMKTQCLVLDYVTGNTVDDLMDAGRLLGAQTESRPRMSPLTKPQPDRAKVDLVARFAALASSTVKPKTVAAWGKASRKPGTVFSIGGSRHGDLSIMAQGGGRWAILAKAAGSKTMRIAASDLPSVDAKRMVDEALSIE